jgi:hypothetical protein
MKRSPLKRRTPLKRSGKLRPVSKKRAGQNKVYSALRREFLEAHIEKCCPVIKFHYDVEVPCTEIHHTFGRENEKLNDVSYWLAVSREGHRIIHDSPNEAREHGWLV